mgnify:CR=1 FL=1
MIIQCESCSRKFVVRDQDIPQEGRVVKCGYCSTTWHQMPVETKIKSIKKIQKIKKTAEIDDSPSVESIKASDGKTYKFLGSQWAELLPSGKTGLFARKKIGQELDEITGRKEKKTTKKKRKKIGEVDPSSEGLVEEKRLPDIYKPKKGIGFFGYIFLIIIVGFSIVGILKTFEDDLIDHFPEIEFIFTLLDEQLVYVAESVRNIITIIQDLVNSY